jgi:hypothetical protein
MIQRGKMKYSSSEKEAFIAKMRVKTTQFAIDTIHFCESYLNSNSGKIISYQIIRSATSTGANY